VSRSPDELVDAEFARLCSLLDAQEVGEGRCAFADAWSAVREWMLTDGGDAIREVF
jgi:hypothetical protein